MIETQSLIPYTWETLEAVQRAVSDPQWLEAACGVAGVDATAIRDPSAGWHTPFGIRVSGSVEGEAVSYEVGAALAAALEREGYGDFAAWRGVAEGFMVSCDPDTSSLDTYLRDKLWMASACGADGVHAVPQALDRLRFGVRAYLPAGLDAAAIAESLAAALSAAGAGEFRLLLDEGRAFTLEPIEP